jgi:hypothetical protein
VLPQIADATSVVNAQKETLNWPAGGFVDTEKRYFMKLVMGYGAAYLQFLVAQDRADRQKFLSDTRRRKGRRV